MFFGLGEAVRRAVVSLEYWTVWLSGRFLHIDYVVRWLRAPNPQLVPRVLRAFGAQIGEHTTFKYAVHIDNVHGGQSTAGDFSRLRIGRNVYVGDGVYFDLADDICIGNDIVIAGGVSFITHEDCNRSAWLARILPRRSGPIRVEDGCWVGFGATILHGAVIGARGVIAANALVRGDTEPECVYAGMPAKLLRSLSPRAANEFERRAVTADA